MKYVKLLSVFMLVFFLSGCSDSIKFERGDQKDDFCGPHINFQYCKCANHGEYCESIGMSRGEAKDYVDGEYDEWVEEERVIFEEDCYGDGGIYKKGKCTYCDDDEIALNNECVKYDEIDELVDDEDEELAEGDCKYDSDCDPICEGETAWKMGCNPRENECVKTFDTDCSTDIENFGGSEVSKTCSEGVCVRDEAAIAELRAKLEAEKRLWIDTTNAINGTRLELSTAMLESNKQCLSGLADMTNLLIFEGATRMASVLAGGIPDVAKMTASTAEHAAGLMLENMKALAGSVSDYTGHVVNKVYAYGQGAPAEEEQKLKPHEFIKLNCDLYQYFKAMIAESDVELELALEQARKVDAQLQSLP
ncbi:MAG: hypothetical protein PF572_01225 [Patescibacteria group bacterium]|nr:hypothetical protein [Patescibacteria group bacterium]